MSLSGDSPMVDPIVPNGAGLFYIPTTAFGNPRLSSVAAFPQTFPEILDNLFNFQKLREFLTIVPSNNFI